MDCAWNHLCTDLPYSVPISSPFPRNVAALCSILTDAPCCPGDNSHAGDTAGGEQGLGTEDCALESRCRVCRGHCEPRFPGACLSVSPQCPTLIRVCGVALPAARSWALDLLPMLLAPSEHSHRGTAPAVSDTHLPGEETRQVPANPVPQRRPADAIRSGEKQLPCTKSDDAVNIVCTMGFKLAF